MDGKGIPSFGPYSVVLKEAMIQRRTSVFEENPFVFCKRHRISAGQVVPMGFRAVWPERQLLAMAKLHNELTNATLPAEYPRILLKSLPSGGDDFIEVHIYGSIHRTAIAKVIGPKPSDSGQLIIWRSVERKLKAIGATMEIG